MDFLGIAKTILGVVGDVTGIGILKEASSAIQTLTPEQQTAVQTALMAHQEEMAKIGIEDFKTAIAESLAEINSSDKYTSRARPTGVYCATLITFFIGCALTYCLIVHLSVDMGAIGAIISILTPLWGSAAYYTYNRTQEKVATIKNGSST